MVQVLTSISNMPPNSIYIHAQKNFGLEVSKTFQYFQQDAFL